MIVSQKILVSFHQRNWLVFLVSFPPLTELSVFAVVTVSGSLVVYSMHVAMRALVKVAAHTGDATSLDWHPKRPFVLATGGSADRCVKGKHRRME